MAISESDDGAPSERRPSTSRKRSGAVLAADGWWEQEQFGRQPMHSLRLRFESGRIRGSGHDIIGPFTLLGTIAEDGKVAMIKRYVGMHAVQYSGVYDGEGLMWGQWWIGPLRNRWLIRMKAARSAAANLFEIEALL